MSVSGDWVTPRLNGVKYFEKPALQYWATAALYDVFGVREWTARFFSCLLAFLCIPLTYAFANHLYRSTAIAGAAAAAIALNPFFLIVGQIDILDSALTFFLVASMFAFLRARAAARAAAHAAEDGSREERWWMGLTALCLALAVLTKGIVALVLAGAALVIHMVVTRDVRPLRRWHLGTTVPLFLVVTLPWFVVVSRRNPEFLQFFFIHEHFQRYLTNVSDRVEPWWYFGMFLLLAVLPWLRNVWPAVRDVWRKGRHDPENSIAWFLLIWCGVVFVFFSVSHSKLPPYILPMMPPLAVLLAPRIAERPAFLRQAAWTACAFVTLVAVGLLVAVHRKVGAAPQVMVVWSTVAVIVAVAAAIVSLRTTRWVPAAMGSIFAYQALMLSYSALPPGRTAKALVEAIRPLVGPNTQIFSVNQYRQSVPPYLGRTMRLVMYRGEMEFGLSQDQAGFVPTLDAFIEEWVRSTDAVAFIDPDIWGEINARHLPMHVRGSDGRSFVVSRQ